MRARAKRVTVPFEPVIYRVLKLRRAALRVIAVCIAVQLSGCQTAATGFVMVGLAPIWVPALPFTLAGLAIEGRFGPQEALFAPDGDHVLVAHRSGGSQRLRLLSLQDEAAEELTTGRRFDVTPVYSPDGTSIVFASKRQVRGERHTLDLYRLIIDGSDVVQLTDRMPMDIQPSFSRDGRRIVFVSTAGDSKPGNLFLIDDDGGGLKSLTDSPCHDSFPCFLPDNETIVFLRAAWWGHSSPIAASRWHGFDVFKFRAGDPVPVQLTHKCWYNVTSFHLSPDGKMCLVNTGGSYPDALYLFHVNDPGTLRKLPLFHEQDDAAGDDGVKEKWGDVFTPGFSPDGTRLVFALGLSRFGSKAELFMHEFATGETRRLTHFDPPVRTEYPAFSPDSGKIVFRVDREPDRLRGNSELWVVNADGSGLRELTDLL